MILVENWGVKKHIIFDVLEGCGKIIVKIIPLRDSEERDLNPKIEWKIINYFLITNRGF